MKCEFDRSALREILRSLGGIAGVRLNPLLWLSTWLSSQPKLAGMDGNRTHPGRLNSAPQTVLKTAFLTSARVHQMSAQDESQQLGSTDVR
jgi:hypothetical protein